MHVPYGFATDGGTDTETNSGDTGESVTTEAIDPETETRLESLPDPTTLRDRDDVSITEQTATHEDEDHCEATAAGRAIVGVTNDDGEVLVLVSDDGEYALLPNVVVESDEDWAAAARQTVTEATGTDVRLDGVERLRTVEHVVETDGESRHQNTTQHVVFHASPVESGDGDPAVTRDGWDADWYDDPPIDADEDGDAPEDIRAVLG